MPLKTSLSFNSRLVRLVDQKAQQLKTSYMQFQFQIGAIGRKHPDYKGEVNVEFQFQIGAIGSTKRKKGNHTKHVSIPDWCDW